MKNLKRIAFTASAFIALLAVGGCTDNFKGNIGSYGDNQTVCMMNDKGEFIRKWVSTGKVDSMSGGLHVFVDGKTGFYTKVSGRVIASTYDYCQSIDS